MDKTRTVKKTATVYVQLNGNAVSLHNIRKLAQLYLIFCNTQESDMAIQQCIYNRKRYFHTKTIVTELVFS